jgi:hypothetical protein
MGYATLNPVALCAQPAADTARADRPALIDAPAKPKSAREGYYVEFRVAEIGVYGHSYAVYGIVGGKPNYADLHPMGNYAIMALGHVLPVPANTEWDPDVLKLPVAARYRQQLTPEQYHKLIAAVQTAKANKAPYWNAVTNNCNHYIGVLAEAVGLRVPGQFQVSYAFVPALRKLNEGNNAIGTTAHKPRTPSSPQT